MCATLYYPIQAVYARGLHESVLGNVKVNKNNASDAIQGVQPLYKAYFTAFRKNDRLFAAKMFKW